MMAVHAPITGAQARALSFHCRKALETEIETLLARVNELVIYLDDADGDCDLEDDDPAGDILDERGEAPSDSGAGIMSSLPTYGVDQRAGPTNYTIVSREHYAREAGIVRSASGGWSHAPQARA